nr:serine/threonine protein kinase [Gemmatimonadaceae bacterium]
MSASKICPQCNNEYALDQRFCPLDGATLKTQGSADDLVGSVVADRYYVLRKLGEGGMGQVYLAEHVRMGRKSALKVMHPGMVHDADAISRFNREAANASRISHPNVAAIYDFGETGDGLIYLAMEFVEGDALTQVVERSGALPPLRAADIIRQSSEALSAAHDMGIVHRDLKPDNIMIARNRDGSDCVKVVDFGIAKSNEGSQKVTKTGLVVGTPEYMSPEQLAGDKLDGRSDTYSLALVAFHLLTGRLPFPSESAQESMIMRLTDRPKRLSDMRAEVEWPAELQAVMDRALERDAKARYASAAEFGRDFARAIETMPEAAVMTAGTQVMDATAVIPPTRVAAADAGATAVIGAPGVTPA